MPHATLASVKHALAEGRTIALLSDFKGNAGGTRWCFADTAQTVPRHVLKRLLNNELVTPILRDICGEPIQYGAAPQG